MIAQVQYRKNIPRYGTSRMGIDEVEAQPADILKLIQPPQDLYRSFFQNVSSAPRQGDRCGYPDGVTSGI
jgi:hypothetical protein